MADSNSRGRNTTTKQTSTKIGPGQAQAAARNKKTAPKAAPAFTAGVAAALAAAKAKTTSTSTPARQTSNSRELTVRKPTPAPVKKTSTSARSVSGLNDVGSAPSAMDQYTSAAQAAGYNPNLQYTPIDTSKMMDLLGKWDPSSISSVYNPAYQNIERMRGEGKTRYEEGDTRLGGIYAGLQSSIRDSAVGVQAGYDTARNNINSDAQMLSGAAATDASNIQAGRMAMLKNLGIEAAAPDLVASDNAAAQTGSRVTQAAGVQSNLASTLGANANAYIQNTANTAGMQGAEARSGLLSQYNDYISDLSSKQADIDTSRSQAIASGYQNYQDAYRNLGLQKMQFDMQNNQNKYNADAQNSANGLSMFNSFNDQQMKMDQMAAESAAANAKLQQDAIDRAQQQSNSDRDYALKREQALGGAKTTDLYSIMQGNAAKYGISDPTAFQNAMRAIEGAATSGGLGNNPGEFASRVGKLNNTGIPPYALNALASSYWQTAGAKASGNLY